MSGEHGTVERIERWDGRPLLEIGVGFADQWNVVLPRVFRYLDQSFVDQFFESGALRLSSFARFSKHEDEQRQDKEGQSGSPGQRCDIDDQFFF